MQTSLKKAIPRFFSFVRSKFPFNQTAKETPPSPAPVPDSPAPQKARELDQMLLFLVDLIDEIDALPSSTAGGTDELMLVRSRIEDRILLSDAEIIREQEWNPERQRAIEVEGDAMAGGCPRIAQSHRSGLCVAGRIVRKQEVTLAASQSL